MKRILLTMAAALFAASGAHALTITVDTPNGPTYNVGDPIPLTITVVFNGGETAGFLQALGVEPSWNSSVASVANTGAFPPNGAGTQVVTAGPGTGGSVITGGGLTFAGPLNPPCNANGFSCQFVTQSETAFAAGAIDAQTLLGTLILEADAVGSVGLGGLNAFVNTLGGTAVGASVVFTSNALAATVIPEPGTLLLVGAGLSGLLIAGRRGR